MHKEFCELCWGTGEVDAINGQRMPCHKCSDTRSEICFPNQELNVDESFEEYQEIYK